MSGRDRAGLSAGAGPATQPLVAVFVALTYFIGALDAMVTAVAVRMIGESLGSLTGLVWLPTAMFLATAVTTPAFGKLADQRGRRGLLLVGLAALAAATAGAGLAGSMAALIVCRAGQGLAWGMIWPTVGAILQVAVPPRDRGRYIGFLTAAAVLGAAVAPLLGGALVGLPVWLGLDGWRWVFLVQLPVIGLALILSGLIVPAGRPDSPPGPGGGGRVDWAGSAALALMVVPVIVAWARWRDLGPGAWAAYPLAACCVLGACLFAWSQRRMGPDGVIPGQMLRGPVFRLGLPVAFLGCFAATGVGGVLPLHWQIARGLSPTAAGVMAFVVVLGSLAGSVGESRHMSRTGRYRIQTGAGLALMALASAAVAVVGKTAPLWAMAVALFVYGAGSVAAIASLEVALIRSLPAGEYATASGTVLLARTLGQVCGSAAAMGAVFAIAPGLIARRLADSGAAGPAQTPFDLDAAASLDALPAAPRAVVESGFADAVSIALAACVVVLLAALVLVPLLPNRRFEPNPASGPPRRPGRAGLGGGTGDQVWAARRLSAPSTTGRSDVGHIGGSVRSKNWP